jgi:PKD repeat protein
MADRDRSSENDSSVSYPTYPQGPSFNKTSTMKKFLLYTALFLIILSSHHATSQCNAAFEWEQLQNSLSIHFINQSTSEHDIVSNSWNFGDGHQGDGVNPTHTYDEPGVYLVCLIIMDNEGCVADVCHEVTVEANGGDNCEAFFEYEANHVTQTVHFFDGSESDHDISSYSWNFGDGHTGDGQNPIHEYDHGGTYEVCLTIVSETGCEDTYCHAVFIEELPGGCEAFFEFEVNHVTNTVHFFDGSDSDHDISQYIWDFGDNHSGDGQNPVHVYAEDGTYLVCLTIVTEDGCEDTYCHEVHIETPGDNCEAFFEFEVNHLTQVVHFFNGSESEHDIVSYLWNFGDGHTGDGENPVHEYEHGGLYEVCLTIVSETGCEDTYCHAVFIEDLPEGCEAYFTFDINHENNVVHFFDDSESAHDIAQWFWNFGDGHTGTGENPEHHYDNPGTYEVCLSIVSETGCEDTYCHHVVIEGEGDDCHAAFVIHDTNNPLLFEFIDQSTSDHDIATWLWNFGDGSTDSVENAVHLFDTPGVYTICLLIISETGCVSDICHTLEVGIEHPCEALFSFEINQAEQTVHFFNQSSSEHDIVQFVWNFGDGHTGDGQNPIHEYDSPGTYLVCLSIVDETGCEDMYCHHVVIHEPEPECEAAFFWEYDSETDSLVFHNTSDGSTPHTTWLWTFGDGGTSTEENPQHEYAEDGVYTICLIMIDSTTDCVSDVCHTFVQNYQNEEENNEQQEAQEPPPANFTDGPVVRYSNPVTNTLSLTWSQTVAGTVSIQLLDLTGNRVLSTTLDMVLPGEIKQTLTIPSIPAGLYVIVLTLPEAQITKQVMIVD